MNFTKAVLSAFIFLFSQPAFAKQYIIDMSASSVEFSGTHAGEGFSGVFEKWQADIIFDKNNLPDSRFTAQFFLDSAKTGNNMYDGTLPTADWFDIKNSPLAEFTSSAITAGEDGSYTAVGNLTIRNITKPAEFNFTISDVDRAPVTATGSFIINRLDYDIGKKSDAKAEWVGKDISVKLNITAN